MGLDALSTEDLLALKAGDLSKVSTEGLLALKQQPVAAQKLTMPPLLVPSTAIGEAALNMASGAAAAPIAGLVALGQGVTNLFGGTTGVGDRVRQVQDALTYKPITTGGQTASEIASYPFRKYGELTDYARQKTEDATGSPAAGAVVETAMGAAPTLLPLLRGKAAGALSESEAAAAKQASLRSLRDTTLKQGMDAGYVVPPSATNPTFLGNRIEGIGGKAALAQESQLRNQPVTNALVREQLGIAPDTPITKGVLNGIRITEGRVYEEVKQLPAVSNQNPMAGQFNIPRNSVNPAADVEALKQARFNATEQWKFYRRSGDPKVRDMAEASDAKATQLANGLEQAAQNAGRPDLVTRLQEARKKIAQTHDVERALGPDGNVDARAVGAMLDKGRPLSGNLELIGRFANTFWPFVREESRVPTSGVSKLESIGSLALGMGGHAAGLGWLPGGLPLMAGPARSLALSPAMQGPPIYSPGSLAQFANAITQPAASGSLAALLAAQQQNKQ